MPPLPPLMTTIKSRMQKMCQNIEYSYMQLNEACVDGRKLVRAFAQ